MKIVKNIIIEDRTFCMVSLDLESLFYFSVNDKIRLIRARPEMAQLKSKILIVFFSDYVRNHTILIYCLKDGAGEFHLRIIRLLISMVLVAGAFLIEMYYLLRNAIHREISLIFCASELIQQVKSEMAVFISTGQACLRKLPEDL